MVWAPRGGSAQPRRRAERVEQRLGQGQQDAECRADAAHRFRANRSAVVQHDAPGFREAEAGRLPRWFRREERLEQALFGFRGEAHAHVSHLEFSHQRTRRNAAAPIVLGVAERLGDPDDDGTALGMASRALVTRLMSTWVS